MASKKELNTEALQQMIEQWAERTAGYEETRPQVPLSVLLGEAVDLSGLVDVHFKPRSVDGKTVPGLESVATTGQVSATTAAELRELQLAIGAVHARLTLLIEQAGEGPVERGEELEIELRSALTFLLEDGKHPTGEQQLARLRAEHTPIVTHDGLALALEGYAELADQNRDALGAVGFTLPLIEEARAVAQDIRQRSATRLAGQTVEEQRQVLALRNRLITALYERIRSARRAFRYVFRGYPQILRKTQSEYERVRRRNWKASESGVPEADGEAEGGDDATAVAS
jgi:hypothetical protein